MRRAVVPLTVAMVLLGAAACGGEDDAGQGSGTEAESGGDHDHEHDDHGGGGAQFSEQEADTVVPAVMRDYAVDMPDSVKGRKVFFRVDNQGVAQHEFVVIGADSEPIGGIEPYGRGATKTLALELAPGQYTVACFVKEGARTHADLGMKRVFTVQ